MATSTSVRGHAGSKGAKEHLPGRRAGASQPRRCTSATTPRSFDRHSATPRKPPPTVAAEVEQLARRVHSSAEGSTEAAGVRLPRCRCACWLRCALAFASQTEAAGRPACVPFRVGSGSALLALAPAPRAAPRCLSKKRSAAKSCGAAGPPSASDKCLLRLCAIPSSCIDTCLLVNVTAWPLPAVIGGHELAMARSLCTKSSANVPGAVQPQACTLLSHGEHPAPFVR